MCEVASKNRIQNPVKYIRQNSFKKFVNDKKASTIFVKFVNS